MEAAFRAAARCGIKLTGCNEKGQGLVEYAVILVLIAAAVVGSLSVFGGQVDDLYVRIAAEWPG